MNQDISICVLTENEMGWTEPFELDEVQILDTYYLAAQKSDIAFLKKMDTARLLAGFRTTAGIDTKGVRPYGGWEDSLLGGHCVGHYLTAIAQAVKVTGDKELKEKSQALITGLEECQKKLGTGFLFGAKVEDKEDVEKQFDILEGKKKGETWVPWYNMHKVLAGLVDTYKYTGNETALLVAEKLGDSIYFRANDTLLVNQYVASKVIWEEKNLVLTQKSDVTKSEEVSFVVNALHGKEISDVAIALRIPDWMHGEAVIYVNGAQKLAATGNSEYVLLERNWEDGDVIMAKYPMSVESVGLLDQDAVFAFRYGPTVLAAKLGKEKMGEATWAGIDLTAPLYKVVGNEYRKDTIAYGEPKTTELLDNETLTIQKETSVNEFVSHIERYLVRDTESDTLSFHLKGTDADMTFENGLQFVPFNTLNDERYGIYWYFDTNKNNDKE